MPWVVWRAEFARKQGQLTVKFSRGAAPRTPCMKTRVSLYHIKVLHLFVDRLSLYAWDGAAGRYERRPTVEPGQGRVVRIAG